MSSDSTNEGEVMHFAYLVLRLFLPFPTEIAVLCHHAETNYIFLPGGRVGPRPLTKMNKVEIFPVETLVLQIEFRLPSDLLSTRFFCIGNKLSPIIIMVLNILYMLRMWVSEVSSTVLEMLEVFKQLFLKFNSKRNYSNWNSREYLYPTASKNLKSLQWLVASIPIKKYGFTSMKIENQKLLVSIMVF